MRKVFTIAAREYKAMVGTKAFVISIVMMPILMLGSILAMSIFQNMGEVKQRKIVVIDQTGKIFDELKKTTELRNQTELGDEASTQSEGVSNKDLAELKAKMNPKDAREKKKDDLSGASREEYQLEQLETAAIDDKLRIELSERVRNQDLYAFVEIPADVLDPLNHADPATRIKRVRFYSQDSSLSEARGFLAVAINEIVKASRLKKLNVDPLIVQNASIPVEVKGLGLLARSADGTVSAAVETDPMQAIFLPMGVMMLMFMVIFMAAQPMLESVIEEKSQRIAEVLLGSANPFQLMSGKLLGTVAGSLTIFGIYLGGGYFMAAYQGWTDTIPFHLAPWFIVFQIVGVLFYAAIFMAVGASVSQLKEAQSMLLPVWMMMMSPMFVWLMLVREPLGAMAVGFSLFPPAAPTAMMLRMATGHTIPLWQPILGLVLTMAATLLIVIVASRIFRVGILWQGKTPKLGEIFKWAIMGG